MPTEQEFIIAIHDPAIVTPTDEQVHECERGFGSILPPSEVLKIGMKTAIANLKRKLSL